jgi:hypothetical protein
MLSEVARKVAWREYQEEAAQFYRSLGMVTRVDAPLDGARGHHKVDVLVEFERIGINHRWVVECKLWKRRIPKERVLILQGVVSDVGADRGFLLSEVGFQSGAVTAARFANVTLTNLADLRENAGLDAQNARLKQIVIAVAELQGELDRVMAADRAAAEPPPYEGAFWIPTPGFSRRRGDLGILEMGARSAFAGEFPVLVGADHNHPQGFDIADDLETFLGKAEDHLGKLKVWIDAGASGR